MPNRDQFVSAMISFEGTVEDPPGSNCQWLGAEFGMNCVPWCAIGVSCAAHRVGFPLHEAAVISIERLAKIGWEGMSWQASPEPGDIVCLDFGGRGNWQQMHTGVVVEVLSGGRFWTSECNYQNKSQRVLRDRKYVRGFARIAWDMAAPVPVPEPVPQPQPQPSPGGTNEVQTPTLKQGSRGHAVIALQGLLRYKGGNQELGVDGDFGPETDRWLKDFQRFYNVAGGADGVAGKNTWQALVDV